MGRVNDLVRIGGIMNGRDLSVPNADRLMNHFDHGCEAVRRTRRSRHNFVLRGIIQMLVHTHHDIQDVTNLDGCRNDDALCATLEVSLNRFGR